MRAPGQAAGDAGSAYKGALVALRLLERCFLVIVIGLLFLLFWQLSPGWLNSQTVPFLIAQNAPLEVLAVAMTFSMISANIDLSPGSMLSFAAMVTGLVAESTGDLWYGLLVALALTLSVGVVSGLLVGWLSISAIIVTLSTYIWAAGLATAINDANAIPLNGTLLRVLNQGVGGWTYSIAVVVVFLVVGHLLLTRTRFGFYCRAIGGSSEFARRSGVAVRRYVVYVFLMMGVAIWLATVLSVAQLGAAQSSAGSGLELSAIVAVVIGGTRLTGGEGSVVRSGLGALLLAVLSNGLASLGLSDAYYDLWEGLALIAVLVVSVVLQRGVRRLEGREQLVSSRRSGPQLALEAA
jgi:ribose/xylose/arabinose/galactoside ABC-type transport system permease subunit